MYLVRLRKRLCLLEKCLFWWQSLIVNIVLCRFGSWLPTMSSWSLLLATTALYMGECQQPLQREPTMLLCGFGSSCAWSGSFLSFFSSNLRKWLKLNSFPCPYYLHFVKYLTKCFSLKHWKVSRRRMAVFPADISLLVWTDSFGYWSWT